jgi:hypothetical protein
MNSEWYIARPEKLLDSASSETLESGAVGPVSATRVLELAAAGVVGTDDLIWMAGTDVLISVKQFLAMARQGKLPSGNTNLPAAAAETATVAAGNGPLPDWLADVSQGNAHTPPPAAVPDWMEDVREVEKLSTISVSEGATPSISSASSADMPLDWLEDIRQIEESLHRPPGPAPDAPPPVEPVSTAPVLPPEPAGRPGPPMPLTAEPPAQAGLDHAAAISQPPLVSPVPCGYNPETGQIVDPVAYALFLKAESQRRQEELERQPTVSVTEAFLDAQRALQDWVDADANRPLVALGEMQPIRNSRAIQELLRRYEAYGPVMQEKLQKRLELLVDNRKKFFKAFC